MEVDGRAMKVGPCGGVAAETLPIAVARLALSIPPVKKL